MKTTLNILLLALLALAVKAADKPQPALTVAVYDFTGEAGTAGSGSKVTALITADLSSATNLVLVERAALDKALSEQALGISGMLNSDAVAKIGQLTGAKILVSGQVFKASTDRLVIVANVIGTETGRLYAAKVDGAPDNLVQLTADLSRKVAQTISEQTTNLVTPPPESREQFLARLLKSIEGTNRPSVLMTITAHNQWGNSWPDSGVANELGQLLMKAGFPVLDAASDRKPDVEITGHIAWDSGKQRGNLVASTATLQIKATDRRTGAIIALDHQESSATGLGGMVASHAATVKVTDELAERILPALAK